VVVLTLLVSLLVLAAAGVPAVAGALPAARTHAVVDVHACMLAFAVNDKAELASLLLLSSLLWLGLPAGRTGKHSST
jgi:tryptophan-rich sensory protein